MDQIWGGAGRSAGTAGSSPAVAVAPLPAVVLVPILLIGGGLSLAQIGSRPVPGWTTWVMVSTAVTVWSIAVWVIRYGVTRRAVFMMVLWADAAITLCAVSLHQGQVNMVSLSMFALPSGVVALYGSGPMLGLQTMAAGIGAGVILHLQGLAPMDVAIQTSATLLATISPALAVTVLSARLVRALDRERDLSLHDPLTGVLNRRGLETEMPALLAAALAGRLWVGVVLLDIDHFKQLNDQHGHSAGDLVLQHVSDRLKAGVRAKDAICRLGGEEFAVLCVTEPEDLPALAERLRHDIRAGSPHQVTVSIGATCLDPETVAAPGGTDRIWALIGEADRLMYQAKRAGRDQVCTAASVPETESASGAEPEPGADPEPVLARQARIVG